MPERLKVGDLVRTPEGHIGKVEKINKNFGQDRAGQKIKEPYYYVESPKPGAPIVWWPARLLVKVNDR